MKNSEFFIYQTVVYCIKLSTHRGRVTHICVNDGRSSWVQAMAYRLFHVLPLPEPMMIYCQSGPWNWISIYFEGKYTYTQNNQENAFEISSAKFRPCCLDINVLTHWGRVTHICVGNLTIIGSDNGLSPGRRQAIIWTNAGILLIGPLETNFSEIQIGIQTFSFKKMHLKMSSAKWRPFVSTSIS